MSGTKLRSTAVNLFRKLRVRWIEQKGGTIPHTTRKIIQSLKPKIVEKVGQEYYENTIYPKLYNTLVKSMRIAGCSERNSLVVYNKGEEFFEKLWEEIEEAEERIWLETYIFVNDYIGGTTVSKLTDAAKRGVQVVLIVDSFGSMFNLNLSNFEDLINNGGFVYVFNTQWKSFIPWKSAKFSPFMRDHRKIAVIDNVGFIGGMNIENAYSTFQCEDDFLIGKSSLSEEEKKKTFRDTQCRMEGESVYYLETIFRESFESSEQLVKYETTPKGFSILEKLRSAFIDNTEDKYFDEDELTNEEVVLGKRINEFINNVDRENEGWEDKLFVQVVPHNPKMGIRNLQKSFISLLDASSTYMYITTPYFIPPAYLGRKIIEAADRGVKIKILTSGVSDVPFYKTVAQTIYDNFLKHPNIDIYEYYDKMLHAKTFTMDGIYSSLGSYNIDRTSFLMHMEVMVNVFDPEFSETVEEHFNGDIKSAKKLDYNSWKTSRGFFSRLLGKLLYFILKFFVR